MGLDLNPPAYESQAFMDGDETQDFNDGFANVNLKDGQSYSSSNSYNGPPTSISTPYSFVRRFFTSMAYFYGQHQNLINFIAVTIVSFVTHLYGLADPAMVCWDETHFGKHASGYIKRKFFFDVHPPLGKMTIALFGALSNYDGQFAFEKPGQLYENASYYGMRLLSALYGSMIGPLVYLSMKEMHFDLTACLLGASFVLFDNGLVTLTRYILLDAPLLFWSIFSFYACLRFGNLRNYPFSGKWWLWLCICGTALAMALSVKLSGALIVAFVGCSTIYDLWNLYGNPKNSFRILGRHFLARVAGLIVLPLSIYIFFFYVHFKILSHSGDGDGFMSPQFQMTLIGNPLENSLQASKLAFYSHVTMRSLASGSGMLHSHKDLYPAIGNMVHQQITTYSHNDDNNLWSIVPATPDNQLPTFDTDVENNMKQRGHYAAQPYPTQLNYIAHNDKVRLLHLNTGRNLHASDKHAFVTKTDYLVTGFGDNEIVTDNHDTWDIIVVNKHGHIVSSEKSEIGAFMTYFKLYSPSMNCYLRTTEEKYPKWGFEQQEVTCTRIDDQAELDSSSIWMIMQVEDPRQPKVSLRHLRKGFFSKFIELNKLMAIVNNRFKPSEDSSRPWMWPVLYRGQIFTPFGNDDTRVYLLGNPLIWAINLVAIVIFLLQCLIIPIQLYRSQKANKQTLLYLRVRAFRVLKMGGWVFFAYLFHYLPYYAMKRVLYFHHYFPALMFSGMLSAIVIDDLSYVFHNYFKVHRNNPRRITYILPIVITIAAIIYSFALYAPMVYGMHGPKEDYHHLKLGRISNHWDM